MHCAVNTISLLHPSAPSTVAEIRVSERPGPPPAWRCCPGRRRVGGQGRAVVPSGIGEPDPLSACLLSPFCLASRRMPELQPSPAASVTYQVNYNLFPGVLRGTVKSRLSRSASHSSPLGCWPGWVLRRLQVALCPWVPSPPTLPHFCCPHSHWPMRYASL